MDDVTEAIEGLKKHYPNKEKFADIYWLITELEKARERVKLVEQYASIQASSICHSIAYEKMTEQQKKIESLQSQLTSAREALDEAIPVGIDMSHEDMVRAMIKIREVIANLKEKETNHG